MIDTMVCLYKMFCVKTRLCDRVVTILQLQPKQPTRPSMTQPKQPTRPSMTLQWTTMTLRLQAVTKMKMS